ncbi:MAG: SHOCT domain-containing protein, partial [Microlunatus sp.]|nr:SHOCT domain-containing protein [Microlunatus sp.]
QAQMAAMQAQLAAMAPPPAPAAAPAAGGSDLMTQLKQLADLKSAGLLDDAEFAAAKAKLLG